MASTGEIRPSAPEAPAGGGSALGGGILETLRRPRIMLVLLATWDIVGAVTQLLSDTFLFDLGGEADGILAGRAFSTEFVIPAIIYLYALRNPDRHHQVFWLALIEQIVAMASYFYHWGAGDIGFESLILPFAVSLGLTFLVFPHLFQPRKEPALPGAAPNLPPRASLPPTPGE